MWLLGLLRRPLMWLLGLLRRSLVWLLWGRVLRRSTATPPWRLPGLLVPIRPRRLIGWPLPVTSVAAVPGRALVLVTRVATLSIGRLVV